MPIYEYECAKCGERFEYTQSIKEPAKTVCERCGGALERLISPAGFILKGGGWYKDLYAKKPGGSSSETKTESKPETKPETKTPAKTEAKSENKS
jgi:putative FmdB family regulatory protein